MVSGTSSAILTHCTSRTTVRSAKALVAAKFQSGSPLRGERLGGVADALPAGGRPAVPAGVAHPAGGEGGDDHVVAGRDVGDRLADGGDDAGALVSADGGGGDRVEAVHERDVAVAQTGGGDLDDHVARTRRAHREVVDEEGVGAVVDDAAQTTGFGECHR